MQQNLKHDLNQSLTWVLSYWENLTPLTFEATQ